MFLYAEREIIIQVKNKSLKKALDILECFSASHVEMGITEISQKLSLNKSNVHDIISTFEACGFIEKNKDNSKYKLGLKLLQLSHIVLKGMSFQSVINRCISELVDEIDEIVYFGIRNSDKIMYMDGGFPEKAFNVRWVQGMTAPLTCTAIGKAILAFMDKDDIDAVLQKGPFHNFTDYTITDPAKLYEELYKTRERGYSLDYMEHEYGVKCVGVPVFNRYDELIGAVSTTGPSLRFPEEKIAEYAELLLRKTKEIKMLLV